MGEGTGWPVLRPVRRVWTWFIRVTVGLVVAGNLLQVADVVAGAEELPPWRWVLGTVGTVVALVASTWTWVVAGRLHRPTWDAPRPPDPEEPRATTADHRAARRALRTGVDLTERQRRLVANEVAQWEMATVLIVGLAAQLGSQVVNWSAQPRPLAVGTPLLVACGIQLVVVGVGTALLWRGRRFRDAATQIGALPLRVGAPPPQ